jgi:Tol biopolymer transport system component
MTSLLILAAATALPAQAAAQPVSPAHEGNCQAPVWSADGSRLLYEVNYHEQKSIELYLYEPGKGAPRKIAPVQRGGSSLTSGFSTRAAESVVHEASWAPAFINRFVYSASTASRDYDLFIDGAGAIATGPEVDGGAAWSGDGHWIAFTSARTGQGDLYLLDVHNITSPPKRLTHDATSAELYASWSPDSRSLAYVGHTEEGDNLYVIDDVSMGSSPRRLTSASRTQTRPTWSPDGKTIAYYSNESEARRFDLYVMPARGGPSTRVAQGVVMSDRGPSWTPDGGSLVYVLDDDARFDPVFLTSVTDPTRARRVATETVGNGDLDVVRGSDGKTWLAVAAQGGSGDAERSYKRIYAMVLAP